MTRNIASIRSSQPIFEHSMTVPVRTRNRLRPKAFSRRRNGMVLCWHPSRTYRDPQDGQHTPDGQRRLMSHPSAFPLLGIRHMRALSLTPLRCDFPDAFTLFITPLFQ